MASGSTSGITSSSRCAGCHRLFKRLSTHIAQSPICEQLYTTCHEFISGSVLRNNDAATQSSPLRRSGRLSSNDLSSVTHPLSGNLSSTRKPANGPALTRKTNVQSSKVDASSGIARTSKERCFEDGKIEDDREDGFPSLDDALPWNNEEKILTLTEKAPDRCVLKLYEELLELRSNPLGLDRFSREEKVHIELLHFSRS
ncbi:hypothetical protein MHU86_13760 [Fragilaria crotonensis]|nr:hypothetical protein MHU86_13760 [Fragilaria crotonensis]